MLESERGTRWHPRLLLALVLAVLLGVFVGENTRGITIRFIVPQVSAPLWVALLLTAVLGALTGGLVTRHVGGTRARRRRERHGREPGRT